MSLLALEGVGHAFVRGPHTITVLRDASLEVYPGDLVAVYGQRGAGKTTLMRIAAGLLRPDAGTVCFAGTDLASLSASAFALMHRDEIGWVERVDPPSDELTIVDRIALPLLARHGRTGARRAATAALTRLGVADCAAAHWSGLSDAERTRVAVAGALARQPRLLILDDPTAGLDTADRHGVMSVLRSVVADAQVGVLMAVPDLPLDLRLVLSLSGGRLLAPAGERGTVIAFPGREQPG